MNLDQMIDYLKESISYNTAADIYELPREEFMPYVNRCKDHVPTGAIPYVVLVMLIEEQNSVSYKIKRFLRLGK